MEIRIAVNENMDTDLILYVIASNLEALKLLWMEKNNLSSDIVEMLIQQARKNTIHLYNINKQRKPSQKITGVRNKRV